MPAPNDHLRVTPEDLRSVADEIVDVADEAHHDARKLGGAQDAMNGAPRAFDSPRAHAEIESAWQQVLHTMTTKLAVAADTLSLSAEAYASTEQDNVRRFPN
ncbi:hypothetical protein LWC34_45225 [Kibdelosporangium philippinense]|uniref:Excreted virulence factor EspC, type VII ESX diderm n=1 Tax=Kibdelosporangium philippinense TaxID=211113 RepID=A0ABS8ZQS2_9PSEU|nr:type VII secretion target [Kibdelosporangium philippinense]MCE7009962.1 hypothetical protein [Kibdelosporangium philippinense]